MSQKTRNDLDRLRDQTGASSAAEVIREALSVYDMVSSAHADDPTGAVSAVELARRALEIKSFINGELRSGKELILRSQDDSEEKIRLL